MFENNSTSNDSGGGLETRNITLFGRHRTSVKLEVELWRALECISNMRQMSINAVCTEVALKYESCVGITFTSALRSHIVGTLQRLCGLV